MSDVIKLRTLSEIEDEAAAWVWRLDGQAMSADEKQAFEDWLRRDPRHRRAFEELGGVWDALDILAEAKRDEKIATFAMPVQVPRAHSKRGVWMSAAAALVLAIAGTHMWLQRGLEAQTIATAVGQQRTVSLADGSLVNVNTNTILETSFVDDARDVRLLKGEAHFVVMKDPDRPFRVHAGETVVRAVGTQFSVRMLEERDVEVVVAEGRVEVTAPLPVDVESRPAQPLLPEVAAVQAVVAGQRLAAEGQAMSVAPLDAAALSQALAWRDGAVILDGESLSEAVATLNRYTEDRLVVSDPEVAEMRVGGRFRTNDIDGFLRALQAALPVNVRKSDDGLVYIEHRR